MLILFYHRSLRELDIPHFHHEVVYEAIVLAMEQRLAEFEKYAQRIIDLLQFLGKVNNNILFIYIIALSFPVLCTSYIKTKYYCWFLRPFYTNLKINQICTLIAAIKGREFSLIVL